MKRKVFAIVLSCLVSLMIIGCASRKMTELQWEEMDIMEFHRKVGEGLEALYADRMEGYYEELAFHYSRSDNKEKAFRYLVKVGDKHKEAYANKQAMEYYSRALKLMDEIQGITPSIRGHVYLSLTELHGWIKDYETALGFAHKVLEFSDDRKQRAGSYRIMGRIYEHRGKFDTALEHLNSGIAELGDDTESPEMAHILGALFWVQLYKGNTEEAIETILRGLKIVEGTEHYAEVSDLSVCLVWLYAQPRYGLRDIDKGFEYARRSVEAGQKSGDSFHIAHSTFWLGWAHMQNGEDDIAIKLMKEAIEIYREIGKNFSIIQTYNWLSGIYRRKGDWGGLIYMTTSILAR